jgi:hypothetical protein
MFGKQQTNITTRPIINGQARHLVGQNTIAWSQPGRSPGQRLVDSTAEVVQSTPPTTSPGHSQDDHQDNAWSRHKRPGQRLVNSIAESFKSTPPQKNPTPGRANNITWSQPGQTISEPVSPIHIPSTIPTPGTDNADPQDH